MATPPTTTRPRSSRDSRRSGSRPSPAESQAPPRERRRSQPFDLPERLIGADPAYFLRRTFGHWGRDETAFQERAMAEYVRCFTPATIHASCEDYRASATIDLDHDRADIEAGRRLACPVLVLWGANGYVGRRYDVVDEWRAWADDVRGWALPSGHFVAEEAPQETLDGLLGFFTDDG